MTPKEAIIVDIDGTLSITEHRMHHIKKKPKKWQEFFKAMPLDPPQEWCIYLLNNINTYKILLTGRPDNYRKVTEEWLSKNKVSYDLLLMRKENDYRQDEIVKEEIYNQEVKGKYNVNFAIDDRSHIVEMWTKLGIDCLKIFPKN